MHKWTPSGRFPGRTFLSRAGTAVLGAVLLSPAAAWAQVDAGSTSEAVPPVLERAMESRARGPDSAAVVVFEIADFQCPYCARFAETVAPELHERYVDDGPVQWVFVNLPLHTHPRAWHAAEAALCAGVAGDRFWAMHDLLFREQSAWGSAEDPAARFAEYAARLDVPPTIMHTIRCDRARSSAPRPNRQIAHPGSRRA